MRGAPAGARLTIVLPPCPEELISSWLVRLARANALRFQELISLISDRRGQLLWHDLDTALPAQSIEAIARLTARQFDQVAVLQMAERLRALSLGEQASAFRWLLQRGARTGRPTLPWVQFCTTCLAEDEQPYLRQEWRLAFVVACNTHGCPLRDRCPYCGDEFSFHLIDRNRPALTEASPVSICPFCRRDVRLADSMPAASKELLEFQAKLMFGWRTGWLPAWNETSWWYAGQCLDVLHRVLAQTNASKRMQAWFLADVKRQGGAIMLQPGRPFVAWPHSIRLQAMRWLARAFNGWPKRFVAGAQRHKLSYADACGEREKLPHWYASTMQDEVLREWYVPSAEEKDSIARYLRRSGASPTFYALRGLLGMYVPASERQPLQLAFPWKVPLDQEQ